MGAPCALAVCRLGDRAVSATVASANDRGGPGTGWRPPARRRPFPPWIVRSSSATAFAPPPTETVTRCLAVRRLGVVPCQGRQRALRFRRGGRPAGGRRPTSAGDTSPPGMVDRLRRREAAHVRQSADLLRQPDPPGIHPLTSHGWPTFECPRQTGQVGWSSGGQLPGEYASTPERPP